MRGESRRGHQLCGKEGERYSQLLTQLVRNSLYYRVSSLTVVACCRHLHVPESTAIRFSYGPPSRILFSTQSPKFKGYATVRRTLISLGQNCAAKYIQLNLIAVLPAREEMCLDWRFSVSPGDAGDRYSKYFQKCKEHEENKIQSFMIFCAVQRSCKNLKNEEKDLFFKSYSHPLLFLS